MNKKGVFRVNMNSSSFRAPFSPLLSGLVSECPLEGGNPPGCVFHELRKMSVLERLHALADLTDEMRREMFSYHNRCFMEKGGGHSRKTKKAPRLSLLGLHPKR